MVNVVSGQAADASMNADSDVSSEDLAWRKLFHILNMALARSIQGLHSGLMLCGLDKLACRVDYVPSVLCEDDMEGVREE